MSKRHTATNTKSSGGSDSSLASATNNSSKLPNRNLDKAISSGNMYDVIKLIEASDEKTNEVEQSTLDQGLLMACSRGRKFVVRHLLLKGASIETRDPMGNTPLLVSVEKGFVEIARLLLDKGADVNASNIPDDSASTLFMGNTPLLVSAEKGFVDIARLLLHKGADVNASNIRGDSALTLSVRTCGSKDMIGLLLKQKSVNVNHRNKDGYTCWMKAVEALDFDTLKLLNKSGKYIDKDGNDCKGQTDIKLGSTPETESKAIKGFNVDTIISLLEREAKGFPSSLRLAVFQRDLYSTRFIIDYCISDLDINYDPELLVEFMEDIEKTQRKQCPVSKTELKIIRKLLETCADVYLRNSPNANEVLVKAVNIGSYELVDLLCQHGANPNTQSSKPPYQNAIEAAVEEDRCDLLEVLIKYNANIHSKVPLPEQRFNPQIEAALKNGKLNVVELLLRNGDSFNVEAQLNLAVVEKRLHSLKFLVGKFSDLARSAIDNNRRGIIHNALDSEDVNIINTLLEFCSDVNCCYDGTTPLMHAATIDIMKLLIKRGADVNKKTDDASQSNTLSYIIKRESKKPTHINLKDVVELLLRSGARVNDSDSRGRTPLMVAAKKCNAKGVLRLLLENGSEVNLRSLDNTEDAISVLVKRMCRTNKCHDEVRDAIFYLLDRGGSSSCVSLQNLYHLISSGCLTIALRLVKAGIGPSDIDAEKLQFRHRCPQSGKFVSPLCFALLCNEVKLARYFLDIWYLTNSDVSSLANDKSVQLLLMCRHPNKSQAFLAEFSSQPMSLQKLCFVAVSTSIGTGPDRERKIRDLPLPNKFKDKLRFSGGCAQEPRFDDDRKQVETGLYISFDML